MIESYFKKDPFQLEESIPQNLYAVEQIQVSGCVYLVDNDHLLHFREVTSFEMVVKYSRSAELFFGEYLGIPSFNGIYTSGDNDLTCDIEYLECSPGFWERTLFNDLFLKRYGISPRDMRQNKSYSQSSRIYFKR